MALSALHLFAGAGGGVLSDILLGHRTVGAVEIEEYPRRVLLERQSDGCLPPFPVWDDVRTFSIDNPDTRSYIEWLIERRDSLVVSGGFPCQDVSVAGKGAGITGERSGLWKEFARIIGEIRPRYAFIENSPALVTRGLDTVLSDLAALGMDAVWEVVSAAQAGAPHRRERIWILANARGGRCRKPDQGQDQQPGRTEAKCASALADSHSAQRAAIAAELPKAARGGDHGNQYTGGKVSNDTLPEITIQQAAELLAVGVATVNRAKARMKDNPEAHEAVKRGEKPKKHKEEDDVRHNTSDRRLWPRTAMKAFESITGKLMGRGCVG